MLLIYIAIWMYGFRIGRSDFGRADADGGDWRLSVCFSGAAEGQGGVGTACCGAAEIVSTPASASAATAATVPC